MNQKEKEMVTNITDHIIIIDQQENHIQDQEFVKNNKIVIIMEEGVLVKEEVMVIVVVVVEIDKENMVKILKELIIIKQMKDNKNHKLTIKKV